LNDFNISSQASQLRALYALVGRTLCGSVPTCTAQQQALQQVGATHTNGKVSPRADVPHMVWFSAAGTSGLMQSSFILWMAQFARRVYSEDVGTNTSMLICCSVAAPLRVPTLHHAWCCSAGAAGSYNNSGT
jgi:hypothetical protein